MNEENQIIDTKISFESRLQFGVRISYLKLAFSCKIFDPDTLGELIDHTIKACEIHLILNNYLDYKIGLDFTTSTIKEFHVNFNYRHNYKQILERLLLHAQSKKGLTGRNKAIKINVKALIYED